LRYSIGDGETVLAALADESAPMIPEGLPASTRAFEKPFNQLYIV
jgi:hypothetical protein